VKVALVDRDLNVKPVPEAVLLVRKLGADGAPDACRPGAELTTSFDGTATLALAAGQLSISAQKPVEFDGQELPVGGQVSRCGRGRTPPSS
jgi:hypothetical protein